MKKIRVNGSKFVTDAGAEFRAHGINMVCKDKAKNYIGGYKPEDFKFLKESGFNLIRLGLQWDGAEPEPGKYDEEYFKAIDEIISMAASEDIPVFLDMHQDLYGIRFEDGAPEWATLTDGAEHVRTDLWSESYLMSPAVWRAFDNFWNNAAAPDGIGVRTHYVNLWKYITGRYADNPYVIGYDIMNEPFPGSAGGQVAQILGEFMAEHGDIAELENLEDIVPLIEKIYPVTAAFEQDVLSPFYDEVAGAIRSVDKETIIMLESNYFANAGIPSELRPARDESGNAFDNQAYVPHGYDILVDTDEYDAGGTERVAFIFDSLIKKAKAMGIPAFIGEWGCYPDASPAQIEQARFLLSMLEANGIGNVYFDFSHIYDGHIINALKITP